MNRTEAIVNVWSLSLVILGSLMAYYEITAPKVIIEWNAPNVKTVGDINVVDVKVVGSKLVIILDNGKVISLNIPRERKISTKFEITALLFAIDLMVGLILISLRPVI